jgi:hypothetical protein
VKFSVRLAFAGIPLGLERSISSQTVNIHPSDTFKLNSSFVQNGTNQLSVCGETDSVYRAGEPAGKARLRTAFNKVNARASTPVEVRAIAPTAFITTRVTNNRALSVPSVLRRRIFSKISPTPWRCCNQFVNHISRFSKIIRRKK